jgi:hypothetical protein
MNVQIAPELLLFIKMHNNMDVRNGLLGNGSHSGCQRTEIWTSIIFDFRLSPCSEYSRFSLG